MKIYIDAGHGGADSGAVGIGGRLEKDDNLNLALALADHLGHRGHEVKLSRADDSYPALKRRADEANAYSADLFVALHRNSASESANGVEVLYCPNASKKSKSLAAAISDSVAAALGFKNRGAKCQRAYVLEKTKMPAVTIESGFVTNASDNAKYDGGRNALISALTSAIEKEFDYTFYGAPDSTADDELRYKTLKGAKLWIFDGCPEEGTEVTLESYFMGDEYARISDDAGAEYLVKWDKLKKA